MLLIAPALHGILVAPERQRQQLARVGDALETLDRDEAVDRLELRPQRCGNGQVVVLAAGRGPHLEDHRNHLVLPTDLRVARPSLASSVAPGRRFRNREGATVKLAPFTHLVALPSRFPPD